MVQKRETKAINKLCVREILSLSFVCGAYFFEFRVFKDQTIGHHPQTRAMLDLLDSLQQILVFRLFLITISRQLLIRWSRKEI